MRKAARTVFLWMCALALLGVTGIGAPGTALAQPKNLYIIIKLIGAGEGLEVTSATMTPPGGQTVTKPITNTLTDNREVIKLQEPEGAVVTSVTAGGVIFVGTATAVPGQDKPYQFNRFTPPPPPPLPYNVIQTSVQGAHINAYDGLTITAAGDYTVSTNGTADVPITIRVFGGKVNLTLNGVTTKIPETAKSPAISVVGEAIVTVRADKESILEGAAGKAGIEGSKATVEIKSGVLTADIDAGKVVVSGGSVFGKIDKGIETVPVEITLDGAQDKTKVAAAEIADMSGYEYVYGLSDVYTKENKLRFFLPAGAMLSSVTAGGKRYTREVDFVVPRKGGEVALYPPQYAAYRIAGDQKTPVENTYRYGLTIGDGQFEVSLADGVDVAKAPLIVKCTSETRVDVYNLIIDTKDRALVSVQLTAPNDALTVVGHGANRVYSMSIEHPRDSNRYDIRVGVADAQSSIYITQTGINIAQQIPAAKAAAKGLEFVSVMNDCTLTGTGGTGGGMFNIEKNDQGVYRTGLKSAHFIMNGVLPLRGPLVLEDAQITVGKNGLLLILGGSSITGTGRVSVEGKMMGNPDVDVWYGMDISAMGEHPLNVTGVTNGYAKSGDTVTVSLTNTQDFIGWEISPVIAGLDLRQSEVSFTADQAYTVFAGYRVPVIGVAFEEKAYEVETGDSLKLKWTVSPQAATDKAVTLFSDHPEIAEVDETGVVYGVNSGTAVITLKSEDGGFTSTCEITVTDGAVKPLDVKIAAIRKGETIKLTPPAGYEGAWSVKNESIAVIKKKNRLKGVELGETELVFTVGAVTSKHPGLVRGKALAVGESASVPLAVRTKNELVASVNFGGKKVYLAPGEEMTLAPTFKPQTARDKALYYRTSDARIVRTQDGKLTAMGLGKATVTAIAPSFVKKKLTVVVTDALQKLVATENKVTVALGNFYQCLVVPQPLGLTDVPVTWVSKNPQIASVDDTGMVKGLNMGKAKIVAASGKKKATITVTVE